MSSLNHNLWLQQDQSNQLWVKNSDLMTTQYDWLSSFFGIIRKKRLKLFDVFIEGGLLSLYFYPFFTNSLIAFESQLTTVVFQYLQTFSYINTANLSHQPFETKDNTEMKAKSLCPKELRILIKISKGFPRRNGIHKGNMCLKCLHSATNSHSPSYTFSEHFLKSLSKPTKIKTIWSRPWTCSLLQAAKRTSTYKNRALPPAPFPLLMYRVLLYFSWVCALFHQHWSFPEVFENHLSEIPRENIKCNTWDHAGKLETSSTVAWVHSCLHHENYSSISWKFCKKTNPKMNENFTYSEKNNYN